MERNEFENRKQELIHYINTIEDEETLEQLEEFFQYKKSMHFPEDYPVTPTREGLRNIINQVLEDDRKGLFISDEEFKKEMETWFEN